MVMRDQTPVTYIQINFNINFNLRSTVGTHWVLVVRREGGGAYHFDSFGMKLHQFS